MALTVHPPPVPSEARVSRDERAVAVDRRLADLRAAKVAELVATQLALRRALGVGGAERRRRLVGAVRRERREREQQRAEDAEGAEGTERIEHTSLSSSSLACRTIRCKPRRRGTRPLAGTP